MKHRSAKNELNEGSSQTDWLVEMSARYLHATSPGTGRFRADKHCTVLFRSGAPAAQHATLLHDRITVQLLTDTGTVIDTVTFKIVDLRTQEDLGKQLREGEELALASEHLRVSRPDDASCSFEITAVTSPQRWKPAAEQYCFCVCVENLPTVLAYKFGREEPVHVVPGGTCHMFPAGSARLKATDLPVHTEDTTAYIDIVREAMQALQQQHERKKWRCNEVLEFLRGNPGFLRGKPMPTKGDWIFSKNCKGSDAILARELDQDGHYVYWLIPPPPQSPPASTVTAGESAGAAKAPRGTTTTATVQSPGHDDSAGLSDMMPDSELNSSETECLHEGSRSSVDGTRFDVRMAQPGSPLPHTVTCCAGDFCPLSPDDSSTCWQCRGTMHRCCGTDNVLGERVCFLCMHPAIESALGNIVSEVEDEFPDDVGL